MVEPVLAGQFKENYIPEEVLMKLIKEQEDKKEYLIIEQIILNVNLEIYKDKMITNGKRIKNIRTILIEISKKHCLVGAALLLI